MNPDRGLWMEADPVSGDEPHPNSFLARNESGDILGPECFAKEMWTISAANQEYEIVPDLAQGINGMVVSRKCADVLNRFDLGNGRLYPVRLLKKDRATPIAGEFFFLMIGNRKQAFSAEHSPRAKTAAAGGWRPPFVVNDDDFAVSNAAFAGSDIWVDTSLQRTFFVSGALADALREAGVAEPFWLRRCKIV